MKAITRLPVIVGFGGYNAAGRSSFHQAYNRLVLDSINLSEADKTVAGLAVLMNLATKEQGAYSFNGETGLSESALAAKVRNEVVDNTLIRRIDGDVFFDPDNLKWQRSANLKGTDSKPIQFQMRKRDLPEPLPENWQILSEDAGEVTVSTDQLHDIKVDSTRNFPVKSAGQLPRGFNPGSHYNSRFHPRALQMAVLGASDAIRSMGIDWETITSSVTPDEIAVFSSNIMAQLDEYGVGGLLQSRLKGGRVSTKNLILGLNSMTTDFINAYVLGNVGGSGSMTGACASYLYNLSLGVNEIRSGRKRVVIVGGCEAPVTSEIIDGYSTMGALATEDAQKKLYGIDAVDHSRSSRPFSDNCGFTIAESSQYTILMDDELAMELGAVIHGSVGGVYLNADGYKKSISAPGPGNFLTLAKAVAGARGWFGDDVIQRNSILLAHGSSTPKNRESESEIFDVVAKAFGIHNWPTVAIKAFLGHSLAPASGDQVNSVLGMFKHKILPGIRTADNIADDVYQDRLNLFLKDMHFEGDLDLAFVNSKGFGGANASAVILSPDKTAAMLEKRYGKNRMLEAKRKQEANEISANEYNESALGGDLQVIYQFGQGMIDESKIEISQEEIKIPGFKNTIPLATDNPYDDMT